MATPSRIAGLSIVRNVEVAGVCKRRASTNAAWQYGSFFMISASSPDMSTPVPFRTCLASFAHFSCTSGFEARQNKVNESAIAVLSYPANKRTIRVSTTSSASSKAPSSESWHLLIAKIWERRLCFKLQSLSSSAFNSSICNAIVSRKKSLRMRFSCLNFRFASVGKKYKCDDGKIMPLNLLTMSSPMNSNACAILDSSRSLQHPRSRPNADAPKMSIVAIFIMGTTLTRICLSSTSFIFRRREATRVLPTRNI
mmetsp:Transcript_13484/g.39374  ORF Transcript_13484/g.39374 Transcript_13484/m.39374 type:complete len:254 (+) Transcript_13484:459-1220(+)